MKIIKKNILTIGLMIPLLFAVSSCTEFLNRPNEDGFNVDNFYQTEDQCFQAVNPIYNSPWYDFSRFWFSTETMAGNIVASGQYGTFTVSSSDGNLINASASLWSVNAYCNGVIENIDMKSSPKVSQTVKNTVKGEALVWKAMAYFYLVRCWGGVPIIHENSAMIASGQYNTVYRATIPNIYDYIIMTLNKAIEWLPEKNQPGRIDRYCAYGLLAKVYLYKSGYGRSGDRNQDDLDKAAEYAKLVIDNSGRTLMSNYEDIFRLHNNKCSESLIAWQWVSNPNWTSGNGIQSDLAVGGFTEFNDSWGDWTAPSVDLQDAFGVTALSKSRVDRDLRRHATMMMYGDHYDYFWRDRTIWGGKPGFDYKGYVIDSLKAKNVNGSGSNCVKQLVGNQADQLAEGGGPMYRMINGLATHLLRLSDVYLIYAEAKVGNAASTSDASALAAFNAVRMRAIPGGTPFTSITWDDVWRERRLELALEGDRWYDYVRLSYYNPQKAFDELKAQRRASYDGLAAFYTSGSTVPDPNTTHYSTSPVIPNPAQMYDKDQGSFIFPFPNQDVVSNPNLLLPPVDQDISQYKY